MCESPMYNSEISGSSLYSFEIELTIDEKAAKKIIPAKTGIVKNTVQFTHIKR